MIVNHKYKFVIFHVPKTGGSSIRHLYRDVLGNDRSAMGDAHKTCRDFVRDNRKQPTIHYARYGMRRNPWDRLESSYRHMIQRTQHHNADKPSFGDFVRGLEVEGSWAHGRLTGSSVMWPQCYFTECPDDNPIELLPFEDFEASAREVAKRHKFVVEGPVPRKNVSDPNIDTPWDEECVAIVRSVYTRDVIELGYEFKGGV